MREGRNAREADRRRQPIRDPRNPSMPAISFRNHCGDRENSRRVARWETAALVNQRRRALEKSVGEVAAWGDRIRPQAPRDQFHRHGGYFAVQDGFAREQSRLLGVRALAHQAVKIKSGRNQSGHSRRVGAAEYLTKFVEGSGVISEMKHDMRIGGDEPSRGAYDSERWQPVFSLREVYREQPHLLLVSQNTDRKVPPGNGLVGRPGGGIRVRIRIGVWTGLGQWLRVLGPLRECSGRAR